MLEVDIRELLDPQRVGMDQRKEEMGIFTSKGMYLRMLFRIKIFMMEFTFPILTEWPEGFFLFAWSDLNIQKNRNLVGTSNYRLGFQWALNRLNERTLMTVSLRRASAQCMDYPLSRQMTLRH